MMISGAPLPTFTLYAFTFGTAFLLALGLTPVFRALAVRLNVMDRPSSNVKTHRAPVPYLGGLAVWTGWAGSLFLIRFLTDFPTGTLRSLRGILIGSVAILGLGLIDDVLPQGLGFRKKFFIQFLAALGLFIFDIRIQFISPYFVALIVSLIWIVGITNAFNIVDIMDGLSSGIALFASLAFLFIALPTEQVYVNFCAAALAGGCLGFIPYNLSKKRKIFMGDTGSLTIGFILVALSMGTSYTEASEIGLFAPLLILAIPIYDTVLVMYMRWSRGRSPFLGSRDHFALRLELMGFSRRQILAFTYTSCAVLSFGAFLVTRLSFLWSALVFLVFVAVALYVSTWLSEVEVSS